MMLDRLTVALRPRDVGDRGRLVRRLRRIDAVFGIAPIVGESMGHAQIVDYYQQCFDAYARYHSPAGSVHMALNPDGRFDPDGFYGQARLLEAQWRDAPPRDVLELAFGKGINTLWLAQRWPQVRFAGIDLTPMHVAHARAEATRLQLTNVALERGDLDALTHADASFDAVFSVEAFCYARDLAQALAGVARVLRPGGRLTLVDAYRELRDSEMSPEAAQAAALVEKSMALQHFQHVADVQAAAEQAGLRLVTMRRLDEQIMPNLKRIERLTGSYLRIPLLARWMLARRPAMRGRNLIAGWLMPLTLGMGLHSYRQFTFEKPA